MMSFRKGGSGMSMDRSSLGTRGEHFRYTPGLGGDPAKNREAQTLEYVTDKLIEDQLRRVRRTVRRTTSSQASSTVAAVTAKIGGSSIVK